MSQRKKRTMRRTLQRLLGMTLIHPDVFRRQNDIYLAEQPVSYDSMSQQFYFGEGFYFRDNNNMLRGPYKDLKQCIDQKGNYLYSMGLMA